MQEAKVSNIQKKPNLIEQSEDKIHISIVNFLEKIAVFFYHIPNGGYRNQAEGAKLKRMGVKAGIPDLCIPIPLKPYHGLYLEVKRERNYKVSDAQKFIIPKLNHMGYHTVVVRGFNESLKAIREYFSLEAWENADAVFLHELELIKRKLAMFKEL